MSNYMQLPTGGQEKVLLQLLPSVCESTAFPSKKPLDCHHSLQLHCANRHPAISNKKKKKKTPVQYHKDKYSHESMFPMGDDKQALMQCKNELLVIIFGGGRVVTNSSLFLLQS